MDGQWIRRKLREKPDRTQVGLSKALGRDPSIANKILAGRRKIKAEEVPLILAYFGEQLETTTVTTPSTIPPPKGGLTPETLVNESNVYGMVPLTRRDPRDLIRVLGATEGGDNGSFYFNGETVDQIARPPFLAGATNGYALFVQGDSMVPRYYPGETVYIHPNKPVVIGSYVVVQVLGKDEGGPPLSFLKRLVRRTAETVFLEQHNPAKTIEVPTGSVVSMHRVVGGGDG